MKYVMGLNCLHCGAENIHIEEREQLHYIICDQCGDEDWYSAEDTSGTLDDMQ